MFDLLCIFRMKKNTLQWRKKIMRINLMTGLDGDANGKVAILPACTAGFIRTYCAQKEREKLNENAQILLQEFQQKRSLSCKVHCVKAAQP